MDLFNVFKLYKWYQIVQRITIITTRTKHAGFRVSQLLVVYKKLYSQTDIFKL